MTWLVVLGNGSWTTGGVTYRAGKHEIDDDTVERARKAIKRRYPLLLSEVEPDIVRDEDAIKDNKPLVASEVRFPRKRGVAVKVEAAPVAPGAEPPPPSADMADEFPCDQCVESFPTPDSLLTHVEFEHAADGGPDVAQGPEGDANESTVDIVSDADELGKAAAFATPDPEPIPWPEDDPAPHIPMPETGHEESVIHDVQTAPPIDRTQ